MENYILIYQKKPCFLIVLLERISIKNVGYNIPFDKIMKQFKK